jgi:hypothetical protein
VSGRFSGTIATGTLRLETTFSVGTTTYRCSSGTVTWTAGKS